MAKKKPDPMFRVGVYGDSERTYRQVDLVLRDTVDIERPMIRGPEDVHRLSEPLHHAGREHFAALYLDGRHRLIGWQIVSIGTATASLLHPREVFAPALHLLACGVILVHNHPSGECVPSGEDREVTKRLRAAGDLLGIHVLDHVIVGSKGFHSMKEGAEW